MTSSDENAYAQRLYGISNQPWKRVLAPINPYRIHIRLLVRGRCLDIGCGFGRNLGYLGDSKHVGVEPNQNLRDLAIELGHNVIAPHETQQVLQNEGFDTLIFSHVLEHLTPDQHPAILRDYLPYLKVGGLVIVRIPQRAGFDSDDDHRYFWTNDLMEEFLLGHGLTIEKTGSFPLPEFFGRFFKYNEWVFVAIKN